MTDCERRTGQRPPVHGDCQPFAADRAMGHGYLKLGRPFGPRRRQAEGLDSVELATFRQPGDARCERGDESIRRCWSDERSSDRVEASDVSVRLSVRAAQDGCRRIRC